MKKEQKETWRELIRKPEGLSWRDRERMWGMGLGGGLLIFLSAYLLFFQGRSVAMEKMGVSCFGFFGLGAVCIAMSVSTFLIYYRRLTDRGLFWAGVVNRVGQTGLGLTLLLIFRPWERAANGRASFVECVVLCALALAYSLGFGAVPLVRLVRAYRYRDCEEHKKAKPKDAQEKESAKFGFWALGLLLLAAFLVCLVMEFQYLKVKAEYEAMQEVRFDQRQETEFDEKRYDQVSDTYHTLHRWVRGGRYNVERGLSFFGFGLLLWVLTLVGRLFSRAAWRSVERDERRERKKPERDRARQRSGDPWE